MTTRTLVAVAASLVALTTGCGGSDSDADSTSAASKPKPCAPVGVELESDPAQRVDVTLEEFRFTPSTLEVPAGVVTFAVENKGSVNHELAFLPGGGEVPLDDEGAPDEPALADAGAFELESFGPGLACNATYELEAGTYSLFCIVETDGRTHYERGMRGTLVVT